jgi:hypothetical protein
MKKINFKNMYECTNCLRKFYGYIDKCPICKEKVKKLKEKDNFITLIKGPKGPKGPKGISINDYYRPENT